MQCPSCKKDIIPTKKFSIGWFIAFLILFFPIAIIQLVIYLTAKATICPACGIKNVYQTT